MRFVSWNVNGLRAAIRKGIDEYFQDLAADVVMLQETRTLEEQLPKDWSWPASWTVSLHPAEKKGYSGVATATTLPHTVHAKGKGGELATEDREGRVLVCEVGEVVCINTYLPSGSNKDERQRFKEDWMEEWRRFIRPYLDDERPVVVCGDLNIAHQEIDLKNWRGNQKNSGFLPAERKWMTELFEFGEFRDVFRNLYPDLEMYTWWSNRGRAWEKNVGWRIDYQIATPRLAGSATDGSVFREERFSDHCPLIIDYDWELN